MGGHSELVFFAPDLSFIGAVDPYQEVGLERMTTQEALFQQRPSRGSGRERAWEILGDSQRRLAWHMLHGSAPVTWLTAARALRQTRSRMDWAASLLRSALGREAQQWGRAARRLWPL